MTQGQQSLVAPSLNQLPNQAWLVDPVTVRQAAQIVYGSKALLQEAVNGDTGAGSSAIRITTGITSDHELFVTSIALLSLSALFLLAGWYHQHVAVPVATWFNDVDAILNHHLSAVIGLGSLSWAGHPVHVAIPVDILLRLGCDPLSLPEGGKTVQPGLGTVLLLGGSPGDNPTSFGGLNPLTGSLWLTDIAHHHVAVAVTFLLAGHLYRTQFSIGARLTSLLASHRTTFVNTWHAQLALSLGFLHRSEVLGQVRVDGECIDVGRRE